LRKSEQASRRKRQSEKALEKEKKDVIDKLLNRKISRKDKKQIEGAAEAENKSNKKESMEPKINYTTNASGSFLSFPTLIPSILQQSPQKYPPPRPICQVSGCKNPRRYSTKNSQSVCSLACYSKLEEMVQ